MFSWQLASGQQTDMDKSTGEMDATGRGVSQAAVSKAVILTPFGETLHKVRDATANNNSSGCNKPNQTDHHTRPDETAPYGQLLELAAATGRGKHPPC